MINQNHLLTLLDYSPSEIRELITEIDFNHPLAGKNITFEVEIFKVTPEGQQGIKLM